MGLFKRSKNNVWDEVNQSPQNAQILFSLIITSYGYIRSMFSQIFMKVLENTLMRGIRDKSGNLIQYQQIKQELKDRLINNIALALLPFCNIPKLIPLDYFVNYPITSFFDEISALFEFDEGQKEKEKITKSIGNFHYSKNSDEARTQLLVIWQKLIGSTDPEFFKLMNVSGFIEKWGECEYALYSGLLKGIKRTEETKILTRGKQECKNFPTDYYPILKKLLESINSQISISSVIENHKKYSKGIDSINKMDDGRFVIQANHKSDFGGFLSATLQIILSDLNQSDRNSISRWAGLPQYQWTRKHQIAAEYSLKKYLLIKHKQGRIPPKIQPIIPRLIEEEIDENKVEIPSELIMMFDGLLGF